MSEDWWRVQRPRWLSFHLIKLAFHKRLNINRAVALTLHSNEALPAILFCHSVLGSLPINEVTGHGRNGSEGDRLGHITSSLLKVQQCHIHSFQSKYILVKRKDWGHRQWKNRAEVKPVSATNMSRDERRLRYFSNLCCRWITSVVISVCFCLLSKLVSLTLDHCTQDCQPFLFCFT